MANGGSFYVTWLIMHDSLAYELTEETPYVANAPLKFVLDDELEVPPEQLVCTNFGRYDSIHRIGHGRVDVIVRANIQTGPAEWQVKQADYLPDVEYILPRRSRR